MVISISDSAMNTCTSNMTSNEDVKALRGVILYGKTEYVNEVKKL